MTNITNMKYIPYIIIAGVTAVGIVGCSKETAQLQNQEELPIVAVDVVHTTAVPQIKNYSASVQAENINNIAPATPNRIKTIAVEVGDHVRAGQTLVTLDSSNADQLRINLEHLEREYNRAVHLLEIGSGTQQMADQLRAQLDAARSQYNNMMENTELKSPITGVVTARNFDPGDLTGGQPVLTVGQLTPNVKIMINVSENDLSMVRQGIPVEVSFDAYPGEEFSGVVSRVHPTVEQSSRTFAVEVAVANPQERLRPGMFARVKLDLGAHNNVVVPDRAVVKQTGSGNKYVYILRNGAVEFKRVQLGTRIGDNYEVLEGVADGDSVVVSGQSRLADGVQVEVQNN